MSISSILGVLSGDVSVQSQEVLLFNKVIGFRGIVEGVGCSSIVAAVANAFSDRTKLRVCVIDTSVLYPSQYALLCDPFNSDARAMLKDWFSQDVSINERIIDTKLRGISLVGCFNRRMTDAFSSADTMKLVEDTFALLKQLFDVILVDLSHEWSQVAMCSARQCNKIFTIVDPSARCVNNMMQSLNNLAICAVPFHKYCTAVINKYSINAVAGLNAVLGAAKLNVVAQIPFSEKLWELNTLCRTGWGHASTDYGVGKFNEVVDQIMCSIVNETPLEVLDLEAVDKIEREVADSSVRNKSKLRAQLYRQREALLHPASEEEKSKARAERKKRSEKFKNGTAEELQGDVDVDVVDFSVGMLEDESARVDVSALNNDVGGDSL